MDGWMEMIIITLNQPHRRGLTNQLRSSPSPPTSNSTLLPVCIRNLLKLPSENPSISSAGNLSCLPFQPSSYRHQTPSFIRPATDALSSFRTPTYALSGRHSPLCLDDDSLACLLLSCCCVDPSAVFIRPCRLSMVTIKWPGISPDRVSGGDLINPASPTWAMSEAVWMTAGACF